MIDILEKIVTAKRKRIPDGVLHDQTYQPRPFLKKNAGLQIIAEIKRGSPSVGLIAPNLDVVEQANLYNDHGATAISVLTEEDHFFGSIADLSCVRQCVALPILRKDFVFTEEQIWESVAVHADAVLLIVAVFTDFSLLKRLYDLAVSLGLSVLVEVHDRSEIDVALSIGAKIIGINNRDLRSFEVKLETSLGLICHIPDSVITVSESGIKTHADLARLKEAGFDAVLIGEAFIRDPEFLKAI